MPDRFDDREQLEAARAGTDDFRALCELPSSIGDDIEELVAALHALDKDDIAARLDAVSEQFYHIKKEIEKHTELPDDGRDGGVYTKIGWIHP